MIGCLFYQVPFFCPVLGLTLFTLFGTVMTHGAVSIEKDVALATQNAVACIRRWNSLLLLLDYSESINVILQPYAY